MHLISAGIILVFISYQEIISFSFTKLLNIPANPDILMKIGIDYDGTIADTGTMKSAWIRENLGKEVESWNTDRTTCVPVIGMEAYAKMGDAVYERELTLKAPLIDGAAEALARIAQIGEVYLITARGERRISFAREKLECKGLARYFSGFASSHGRTKEQVCSELGLDVIIDDDARHLEKISLQGLRKILIKCGSTEETELANGVEYAKSWQEAVDLLAKKRSI
jgi:hypothetical protein